jgi:acyl-homoserine lactone synthase
MIHVVSSINKHLYEDAIERHFQIRHDIFVGERRYNGLARDGKEIDCYDQADTIYLLAMEGKRIIGGHRLYPRIEPTMTDEVFPVPASVGEGPSDPLIWEWSRFFVVRDRREGRVNFELMAAVQEFCLDEGITHVSAVMEIRWLPRLQQAGFVVHPLGLLAVVEGAWTMAALIEISADTLERVRDIGNIPGSVLTRKGPQYSIFDRMTTGFGMPITVEAHSLSSAPRLAQSQVLCERDLADSRFASPAIDGGLRRQSRH